MKKDYKHFNDNVISSASSNEKSFHDKRFLPSVEMTNTADIVNEVLL